MVDGPQRRKEDKWPAKILAFLQRFFFVVGLATTICIIFMLLTFSRLINYQPPSLPDNIVLNYTFKAGLVETVLRPTLDQPLLRPGATLHEVIDSLDSAIKDDRVKGLIVRLEDPDLTLAQIQELRSAIARFRASGKFTHLYTDSFGGLSSATGDYFLAAAFDEIWMQPVGLVGITGIASETPFVRGVLDRVGVSADFAHRGKYKTAPESLTEKSMTPQHREMMRAIMGDLSAQVVADTAKSRGISAEAFLQLVDGAPYSDTEALTHKLVDRLGYYDEMKAAAMTLAGEDAEAVDLLGYSFVASTINLKKGISGFVNKLMRKEAPASSHRDKPKIALIFGSGDIVPYKRRAQTSFGEGGMAADKIVAAFKSAQADEDVVAVVFRVDSPGGAPEAAESIRRAVMETQEKGKPVIVSMGSYAASGGYWIAAPADRIIALPATLTGSIGVFGGKFSLERFWQKLGVNWELLTEGRHAGMWSSNRGFEAAEYERFDSLLGAIYESFLERVMAGRNLTRAQAEAAAQGRVFTGRQAVDMGLVDELGGLGRAVDVARELAKLEEDQEAPVVRFPKRKSTLEMFIALATEGAMFKPDIQISAADVIASIEKSATTSPPLLKAVDLHLK